MGYYLNLETVEVGQEVAIDPYRDYTPFIFCKVVKVTLNQVHVKPEKEDADIVRFSRVTARELSPAGWNYTRKFDSNRRLVPKEIAEARIATKAKQQAINSERNEIKREFTKFAQGGWTVDTVEEVKKLAERMTALIAKENEG